MLTLLSKQLASYLLNQKLSRKVAQGAQEKMLKLDDFGVLARVALFGSDSARLGANQKLTSEIAAKTDFSSVRYAQCWEDADILLQALAIRPGDVCLSIASAGDNTLAMLIQNPGRVIAIDLNPAQLACLALRVAAYRTLDHPELLELIGSVPSDRRGDLYQRCRPQLNRTEQDFWDARPLDIALGIGHAGKFERYLALFRQYMLPLTHSTKSIERLLTAKPLRDRRAFYDQTWDSWRWRWLFRLFFSQALMGRLGRDPHFFDYVEANVADHILARTRHALIALEPAQNPYLQWIISGRHQTALPYALRPENFERIRRNLDRLEWRCQSLETFVADYSGPPIDRYNLSNVFEYMSEPNYHRLLENLIDLSRPGSRLVYWNMLVPRQRPDCLGARLYPLAELAHDLHVADKAFFYSRLNIEVVG